MLQNENSNIRKKDEDFDLQGINKANHLLFNSRIILNRIESNTFGRGGGIDQQELKRMSVEETVLQPDVVEKL